MAWAPELTGMPRLAASMAVHRAAAGAAAKGILLIDVQVTGQWGLKTGETRMISIFRSYRSSCFIRRIAIRIGMNVAARHTSAAPPKPIHNPDTEGFSFVMR